LLGVLSEYIQRRNGATNVSAKNGGEEDENVTVEEKKKKKKKTNKELKNEKN
jgi:hypothetical protein